jgi:phosphoserine phosphatase
MKKMNPGMMAIMAKKKPMAKKEMSAEMPMKKGGMAHSDIAKDKPMMKKVAAKAVKGHEKKMHGMAKGGGIEIKGKTKGKMIAMKKGGMGKAC